MITALAPLLIVALTGALIFLSAWLVVTWNKSL